MHWYWYTCIPDQSDMTHNGYAFIDIKYSEMNIGKLGIDKNLNYGCIA